MTMYIEEIRSIPVDSYGDVRTLVRGLPYQCPDDWHDIIDSLDEESDIYLIKEPDNPKDELAIAAYLGDRRIGYVAADDNCKVWMFLSDEKTPCRLIQKYEASFKVAFDNPKEHFESMTFEDIYKDKEGWIEKNRPVMEVPFLSEAEDESYDWYRTTIVIRDFEEFIPDFRRKLAAKMIIFVARKNSHGNYRYYLPYINAAVAVVENDEQKSFIDADGFFIAIPEMCSKTYPGGIHVDLYVARLHPDNPLISRFKSVMENGNKEIVFYLSSSPKIPLANEDNKSRSSKARKVSAQSNTNVNNQTDDMATNLHTKSVVIKHPFNINSGSVAELTKLRNLFVQIRDNGSVTCFAYKEGIHINVYLEDGSLFHPIVDSNDFVKVNKILQKEQLLVGEICGHATASTDRYLLIKLYYDYISGNHDNDDICRLWIRDTMANMKGVTVPKAQYVGKESKADKLEKESIDIGFPCYEDDDFDSFDFVKTNFTHKEANDDIIRVTDKHQEDLYHNAPFVVLARQNPSLPMLYELCLPDGTMFGIIGDEDTEDLTLRKWISEVGIVPVTVQNYEKSISGLLELHYRAFKRKSKNQELSDFVSAHFIEDTVEIEMDEEHFEKISEIIDPNQDGSMTENLNVLAIIPKWASQAAYYIVGEEEPLWLAPSFNADILDQVHQNNSTQGRVVNYRDNFDGTYHFELKFHIEK